MPASWNNNNGTSTDKSVMQDVIEIFGDEGLFSVLPVLSVLRVIFLAYTSTNVNLHDQITGVKIGQAV